MNVIVYDLGLIEYPRAADLQVRLAEQVAAGERSPALLLLEHPHVYSFGRQGNMDNLLWGADELARRGISIHHSDRGGDVTYHGPGQLVGYPILPLGEIGTLEYLRMLEETLIRALEEFGITSMRVPGETGVWVRSEGDKAPPAKIASIGVRVDANRITRHGFALNVDPDMSCWQGIIACGLENQAKTSMADWLNPVPEIKAIGRVVVRHFANVLDCHVEEAQLEWEEEDETRN